MRNMVQEANRALFKSKMEQINNPMPAGSPPVAQGGDINNNMGINQGM